MGLWLTIKASRDEKVANFNAGHLCLRWRPQNRQTNLDGLLLCRWAISLVTGFTVLRSTFRKLGVVAFKWYEFYLRFGDADARRRSMCILPRHDLLEDFGAGVG